MKNFKEVLVSLRENTQSIDVYACRASKNGGIPSIGIRIEIAGGNYKDLNIDGNIFMIAGDVSEDGETVSLRAIYSWPYTVINLGVYKVKNAEVNHFYNGNIIRILNESSDGNVVLYLERV